MPEFVGRRGKCLQTRSDQAGTHEEVLRVLVLARERRLNDEDPLEVVATARAYPWKPSVGLRGSSSSASPARRHHRRHGRRKRVDGLGGVLLEPRESSYADLLAPGGMVTYAAESH